LCEFSNKSIEQSFRVDHNLDPQHVSTTYDILLFHHSIEWLDGEAIINAFSGPIVAKYHNITPAEFFKPYSPRYEQICRAGREQSARLVAGDRVMLWQADSSYNAEELRKLGVSPQRLAVVPPFNRIIQSIFKRHNADYRDGQRVELLFVGRRSPNKGHRHLVHILDSYTQLFSRNVILRIVGNVDEVLGSYSDEMLALAGRLGVTQHIEWLTHISDDEVTGLFRSSHVYVNASEHEGFCVPIVEAQSIGLPIVTANAAAVEETAGDNQIVCRPPICNDDYDLMAGLIHDVVTNHQLRDQLVRSGFRNAYERFLPDTIEDLFVSSLEPVWRME
jgi:glycosyltransferase involved in cell wall biosynthesis